MVTYIENNYNDVVFTNGPTRVHVTNPDIFEMFEDLEEMVYDFAMLVQMAKNENEEGIQLV